jgi:hypothetical protein
MKKLFLVLALLTVGILLIIPMACTNHYSPTVAALLNTPTNTPTVTSPFTPLNTATKTFTATATNTATYTFTPTATGTPTDTYTITSTDTPTDTATITSTDTATGTPTDTPTATLTPITISVTGGFQYSTDGGTTALTQPVTAAIGQIVTWDSTNATIHPLYVDDAVTCLVNNQLIPGGGSYSVTFTYASDYLVHCGNHGACTLNTACPASSCTGMAATIHVQ